MKYIICLLIGHRYREDGVTYSGNRRFIGFEISKEYCEIANKRIDYLSKQTTIFTDFEATL